MSPQEQQKAADAARAEGDKNPKPTVEENRAVIEGKIAALKAELEALTPKPVPGSGQAPPPKGGTQEPPPTVEPPKPTTGTGGGTSGTGTITPPNAQPPTK